MSVLLVDDNSLFLRIATRFLQGYPELTVVGSASTGPEALAKVQALQPDLVLLDLNMPGLTGLSLIPQLHSLQPGLKIIVLTLWDSEVYRQAALSAGAFDFVPKAQLSTALLPAIQNALAPIAG